MAAHIIVDNNKNKTKQNKQKMSPVCGSSINSKKYTKILNSIVLYKSIYDIII